MESGNTDWIGPAIDIPAAFLLIGIAVIFFINAHASSRIGENKIIDENLASVAIAVGALLVGAGVLCMIMPDHVGIFKNCFTEGAYGL